MATRHYNRFQQRSRFVTHHQGRKQQLALAQAQDRNQGVAILLALFLGGVGGHHFYLGNTSAGVLSALFCWTGIPALIAIVNTIQLAVMSKEHFAQKYQGYQPGPEQDSVLDAHLNHNPATLRPEEVFDPHVSPAQAARFATLVQHLSQLVQQGTLAFAGPGGQKQPVHLLTNTLNVDGHTLPTLTLQGGGSSLLFSPNQVIIKNGSQLQISSYREAQSAIARRGSLHAEGFQDGPINLASIFDDFFEKGFDTDRLTNQVKAITEQLRAQHTSPSPIPTDAQHTLENETQLTLRVGGMALVLSSPENSLLAEAYNALEDLRTSS